MPTASSWSLSHGVVPCTRLSGSAFILATRPNYTIYGWDVRRFAGRTNTCSLLPCSGSIVQ